MKTKIRVSSIVCLCLFVLSSTLAGCAGSAGQTARQGLLAPAAQNMWMKVIKPLATEGAKSFHEADGDDAMFRIYLDKINQFDEGVRNLGGG